MDSDTETHSLKNGIKQPRILAGIQRVNKPLGEQAKAVRRQELMVILGNLGVFATGMGLGLPTVTLKQLTDPNEPIHLDASQASWYASFNTLSCPLGGLLSGYLLDKIGRKNTLYVVNVAAVISWALMALAIQEDSTSVYIQLMISRFIIGVVTGMASSPVGVYSAEISLPKIRGRLILGTSIAVALGITFIYILGFFIRDDWHLIAMISLCYQVVALLCIIPMPESPSWLASKGRLTEAKQSLLYFRGLKKTDTTRIYDEIESEFNLLLKSIQLGSGEKKQSFLNLVRLPEVYKPLLLMIGLFACQQFTGIFVVIVYAVQISIEAGVKIDPFMCAVLIGVARVVTTCPMGLILEKWGRRRAGMISAFGMSVCMFLLAGNHWFPWMNIPHLPLIAIVAFIVLSTVGIYTLPFFMISEVFPQKVRGPAAGLTVASGLLMSFITIKTYPSMKTAIGNENCFAFYGAISFLAMLYVYYFLPETRGRTLLEIEEQFRNPKRSCNKPRDVEMQEVFVK